jgi:hypothetical protein
MIDLPLLVLSLSVWFSVFTSLRFASTTIDRTASVVPNAIDISSG